MKRTALSLLATASLAALSIIPLSAAVAQRVVDVSPAGGSAAVAPDVSIYGEFEDGDAIDPTSVTLQVNGEDVTRRSTITPRFFSYRPSQPLAPGRVTVRVEYTDTAGEAQAVSWDFTVEPQQQAVAIESVTHNVTGPVATGDRVLATVSGTPEARAEILLIVDEEIVEVLMAPEVSPGVYVASFTMPRSAAGEGIVVGRLQQQGQPVYRVAQDPIEFSTAAAAYPTSAAELPGEDANGSSPPARPADRPRLEFISHRDGDEISGDRVTLVGRTVPEAQVKILVQTSHSVFGLVNVGETILNQSVAANEQGEFRVEVPLRGLISAPGMEYQVSASATIGDSTPVEANLVLIRE